MLRNKDWWSFSARLLLFSSCLLQILRFPLFPFFMDMYYHIHTAWGFLQAGGYSGWDFWQYAPVGRPHMYSPFFHLILSIPLAAGIDPLLIARVCECIIAPVFLTVMWLFLRLHFGSRAGFFGLLIALASNSFFTSLINYIPSALALTVGIGVFHQLLRRAYARMGLLLILACYTHSATFLFILLSVVFFVILASKERRRALFWIAGALVFCLPLGFKILSAASEFSFSGINARNVYEFKPVEYILAGMGLFVAWKNKRAFSLILCICVASLIFLPYPNRFLYGQGYLGIVFLAAIGCEWAGSRVKAGFLRGGVFFLISVVLLVSSSISVEGTSKLLRVKKFDSMLGQLILPGRFYGVTQKSIYNERFFKPMSGLIRGNSSEGDIIYASLSNLGVCFASLNGRATANALFPELGPVKKFDPLATSKIIIMLKDDDPSEIKNLVSRYGLEEIGENDAFYLYRNPRARIKLQKKKASVSFIFIGIFCFLWALGYVGAGNDFKRVYLKKSV